MKRKYFNLGTLYFSQLTLQSWRMSFQYKIEVSF